MKIIDYSKVMNLKLEKNDLQKANQVSELRKAAEKFEAFFIEKVLEQGRESSFKDKLFSNKGTTEFTSLLDKEYANNVAEHADLGIANALVSQYEKYIKNR